mgnify:CR=1 FL=1
MTDTPITQAQLDALESMADKVFAKLGIDIEFTRHFIDRVNDARNRKQITIRELGDLLAKEYKRWGDTIGSMPVSAEAVMKDLSTAINIPFVMNKTGKEKQLVAKTVMRKKDFKTPDKTLPVESAESELVATDDQHKELVQKELNKTIIEMLPTLPDRERLVIALRFGMHPNYDRPLTLKKIAELLKVTPERIRQVEARAFRKMRHPSRSRALRSFLSASADQDLTENPWNQAGQQKPTESVNEGVFTLRSDVKNSRVLKMLAQDQTEITLDLNTGFDQDTHHQMYNLQRMGYIKFKKIGENHSKITFKLERTTKEVNEDTHGAKKGTQVKGRDATPSKRKPTTGGSSPHPMRGKLVGEETVNEISNKKTKQYLKKARKDMERSAGQAQYGKRLAKDNREHDPRTSEYWDEYGREQGKRYGKRNKMVKRFRSRVGEDMDQPPLDVKTPTPSAIAKKHGVDVGMIRSELKKGVKVEMEHTPDKMTAMEIALDHLNEMPDYYSKLNDMESGNMNEMLLKGAWECQQIREDWQGIKAGMDPREAILNKALRYLEKMHNAKGDEQDIGGYAFDIARSFNLNGIATAKELAKLYREWKGIKDDRYAG